MSLNFFVRSPFITLNPSIIFLYNEEEEFKIRKFSSIKNYTKLNIESQIGDNSW